MKATSSASMLLGVLHIVSAALAAAAPTAPTPIRTLEGSGYVASSPDGKLLVGNTPGETWRPTDVKVWRVKTGEAIRILKGHKSNIWKMSFGPTGKRLVTNENWVVKLWDFGSGQEVSTRNMPAFTRSVIFVREGRQFATGHDDGRIIFWDTKTSQRVRTLKGHTDWVPGLALSPDGTFLSSASVDMTAKLWDLAAGNVIRTFSGHEWYLNQVAFDPQGKRLATTSDDMTARVWDVETGRELLVLRGHTDWVVPIAFSPSGGWIVTGSSDNTARIWDAASGEHLLTLEGHTERVGCVTFSPDGRMLVTADNNLAIKVWNVSSLLAGK